MLIGILIFSGATLSSSTTASIGIADCFAVVTSVRDVGVCVTVVTGARSATLPAPIPLNIEPTLLKPLSTCAPTMDLKKSPIRLNKGLDVPTFFNLPAV